MASMRKKALFTLSIIIICLLLVGCLTGEGMVVWEKCYDISKSEEGFFISTDGNRLIITGRAEDKNDSDLFLLCIDGNGEVIFSKTFGGKGEDIGKAVINLSDGYLVVGYTSSYGKGGTDTWLVKVDKNGTEIWNKTYGGDGYEKGMTLIRCDDGYLIAGSTTSYSKDGSTDAWLVKVDKNGNEIWNKTYGGDGYDEFRSGKALKDGEIVLAGMTSSYKTKGDMDAWIVWIDGNGMEIRNSTYGEDHMDLFNDVAVENEKIIAVGHSECKEDKWSGLVVITDGNETYLNRLEGDKSTGLSSIVRVGDFCYAVGYEGVFGSGEDNLLLVKINESGKIIWRKTFGGRFEDAGVWICGYKNLLYLVGYKDRYGNKSYDCWVIKLKIH